MDRRSAERPPIPGRPATASSSGILETWTGRLGTATPSDDRQPAIGDPDSADRADLPMPARAAWSDRYHDATSAKDQAATVTVRRGDGRRRSPRSAQNPARSANRTLLDHAASIVIGTPGGGRLSSARSWSRRLTAPRRRWPDRPAEPARASVAGHRRPARPEPDPGRCRPRRPGRPTPSAPGPPGSAARSTCRRSRCRRTAYAQLVVQQHDARTAIWAGPRWPASGEVDVASRPGRRGGARSDRAVDPADRRSAAGRPGGPGPGSRHRRRRLSTPTTPTTAPWGRCCCCRRVWRAYASDADDNQILDPYDIDDASLAMARLLCSGGEDLSQLDRLDRRDRPAARRGRVRPGGVPGRR